MENKIMLNSERFLIAYNSIEKSLNEINGSKKYIPFSLLLSYCAKQNKLVEQHYADLKEYNELRNAIVHHRDEQMEIIAEPSDATVNNIEHIAEVLKSGKYALNYANKPVHKANENQTIKEIYDLMKEHALTKMPVYRNDEFLTLITMEEIAGWSLEHIFVNQTISEILDESKQERVVFIRQKSSIHDVITLFENSINNKQKTPFIIITETGNCDEEPLGVISTYDLVGILSAML